MSAQGKMSDLLIVGAGIGGLSAAIALGQFKERISIIEQSAQLGEVGAGVQLGPNVTRILKSWGVYQSLDAYVYEPSSLEVHSALNGQILATLPLGESFRDRYGAPYHTVHRADLHAALLECVVRGGYGDIHLSCKLSGLQSTEEGLQVSLEENRKYVQSQNDTSTPESFSKKLYQGVIGADGVWSKVRDIYFDTSKSHTPFGISAVPPPSPGGVTFSGDLAYRSLVMQKMLPPTLRSSSVKVWLGPDMHLVQYPVRGGEWLNSVLILNTSRHSLKPGDRPQDVLSALDWTLNMSQAEKALNIHSIFPQTCSKIQDTLRAIDTWSVWPLMRSNPLKGPMQMARGQVALLGDAAHPMLPYLAQGAGMAIEDAFEMGKQFKLKASTPSQADGHRTQQLFMNYAQKRWLRNASVQKRALMNADIFHAKQFVEWARDRSLKLFGPKLLDMPWLYGYKS